MIKETTYEVMRDALADIADKIADLDTRMNWDCTFDNEQDSINLAHYAKEKQELELDLCRLDPQAYQDYLRYMLAR